MEIIVALFVIGFVALAAEYAIRLFVSVRIQALIENVPPLGIVEADAEESHESREIPCEGETVRIAIFRPAQQPVGLVVYCPELHGPPARARRYLSELIKDGFAVIGVGFRRSAGPVPNGQPSENETTAASGANQWATTKELADVHAALDWIKRSKEFAKLPLGLFGVSRGGGVALAASAESTQVQAVACESAFSCLGLTRQFVSRFSQLVLPDAIFRWLPEWHVSAALKLAFRRSERAQKCTYLKLNHQIRPDVKALLISGKRDSYVKPGVTEDLRQQLGLPPEAVWLVPKARHNSARQIAAAEYDRRLIAHFRTAFGLPLAEDHDQRAAVA